MKRSRNNRLVILLKPAERAVIERMAASECLPVSTFARSRLLNEAAKLGLSNPKNSKSAVTLTEAGAFASVNP